MKAKLNARLPLTHALGWIVLSMLLMTATAHNLLKFYFRSEHSPVTKPVAMIRSIVQTGPQKEALKTEYFAELLGISADRPPRTESFDLVRAKESLNRSPLLSRVDFKLLQPDTLYIDYTVRQPIAWLSDYDNIVIDKEGYVFPFHPFFSPKNLPEIYIGLSPFGDPSSDPNKPSAQWGIPLTGRSVDLAMHLYSLVTDIKVADLFNVKRIDVSQAFHESSGTREIVLITEDLLIQHDREREVHFTLPRILRLSSKNYAQELGNYLKLRVQLLEEERNKLTNVAALPDRVRAKEKVIDFRIPQLAFIDDQK